MRVASRDDLSAFTTKDGSEIREFHHTSAQSLAEASLAPGQSTQRHYHAASEEIYFVLEGEGELEIDGERRHVGVGDAALIPAGAWHEIVATSRLRFLCCCAPPYSDGDTFMTLS
jgi:mannose-6-phosphate isomerase-like protein (cupin superfamily)